MIYDIEEYVEFLCDKGIDANEYLLCMVLYYNNDEITEKFKRRFRIFEPERSQYIKTMLKHLIAMGYVEDFNTVKPDGMKHYETSMLMVTPLFHEKFLINSDDAAKELWDAYPKWLFIDKNVPSKAWDYDEYVERYTKIIKGNKKLHKHIMEMLNMYKQSHTYAEMNFKNFVTGRHWENLEDLYKGDQGERYGESEF